MVKKLIKNIRSKPKATRDSIAFGVAGAFTVFVFAIWIYNLPDRMETISARHEDKSSPAFSQLFDKIGDQFSAVKEAVSEENPSESDNEGMFDDYETNFRGETPNVVATSSMPSVEGEKKAVGTTSTNTASASAGSSSRPVVQTERTIRVVTTSSTSSNTGAGIE